jgi:hypothetical protein
MFEVKVEDARSILYLLDMELEGKKVRKIGITSKRIEDRLVGIATSVFSKHRYFPYIYPKRFRKVDSALVKEQKILEYMKEYKWASEKEFGGHTEMLDVELDVLVDVYEKVVKGEELLDVGEECGECGKVKKFEVDGAMKCGHLH